MENTETVKGIESLRASVVRDCAEATNCFNPNGCDKQPKDRKCFHEFCDKFKWVMDRAAAYAPILGLTVEQVIEMWEKQRDYWYMNFYQDSNQPLLDKCRVFETVGELLTSVGGQGFRCPKCDKVSKDAYTCTQKPCDWKAYGLFHTLGKGVDVVVKKPFAHNHIFMPVAWEEKVKKERVW